jgi:hypothetical protein
MKPEQQEIERLRREVAKLKAERDILRRAAAYFASDATYFGDTPGDGGQPPQRILPPRWRGRPRSGEG